MLRQAVFNTREVLSASQTKVFALRGASYDPSTSRVKVIQFMNQVSKPGLTHRNKYSREMHKHTGHMCT